MPDAANTPEICRIPDTVVRITRPIDPLAFSRVGAVEARNATQGNRFDVPGGGVLYAATQSATSFHEVCARFRPSAFYGTLNYKLDDDAGFPPAGIPADWRLNRRLYTLQVKTDLPFVDISNHQTWKWLEDRMPGLLLQEQLEHVEAKDVYSSNRRLTRAFAAELYTAVDSESNPLFGGIRYESRLNNGECWAIFEHPSVNVKVVEERAIEANHPDLLNWSRMWHAPLH